MPVHMLIKKPDQTKVFLCRVLINEFDEGTETVDDVDCGVCLARLGEAGRLPIHFIESLGGPKGDITVLCGVNVGSNTHRSASSNTQDVTCERCVGLFHTSKHKSARVEYQRRKNTFDPAQSSTTEEKFDSSLLTIHFTEDEYHALDGRSYYTALCGLDVAHASGRLSTRIPSQVGCDACAEKFSQSRHQVAVNYAYLSPKPQAISDPITDESVLDLALSNLRDIQTQIATIKADHEQSSDWMGTVYERLYTDGKPVLSALLVAEATALQTIVLLRGQVDNQARGPRR